MGWSAPTDIPALAQWRQLIDRLQTALARWSIRAAGIESRIFEGLRSSVNFSELPVR
jgi:hypothetical protein